MEDQELSSLAIIPNLLVEPRFSSHTGMSLNQPNRDTYLFTMVFRRPNAGNPILLNVKIEITAVPIFEHFGIQNAKSLISVLLPVDSSEKIVPLMMISIRALLIKKSTLFLQVVKLAVLLGFWPSRRQVFLGR